MKIEKLLEELIQAQRTEQKYNGILRKSIPNSDHPNFLGRGKFSTVRNDKTDPHLVKKSNIAPSEQDDDGDGFNIYIKYIHEQKLQDNIHFPRVYTAKKISDKTGKYIYKYTLEKLEEWGALSAKEFEYIVENMFDGLASEGQNYDFNDFTTRVRTVKAASKIIQKACLGRDDGLEMLKPDDLYEACLTISNIAEIYDMRPDVHPANIMFRRTPHGVQLVITDPLL